MAHCQTISLVSTSKIFNLVGAPSLSIARCRGSQVVAAAAGSNEIRSFQNLAGKSDQPWSLTFDLRERETLWTDENKSRLVRMIASYQLEDSIEEVDARIKELQVLLPDLGSRVSSMQPKLLAALVSDTHHVVRQIIGIRTLLPEANVSAILASQPQLILRDLKELEGEIESVKALLDLQRIDFLVEAQPRMLDAGLVEEVLEELQRLLPKSATHNAKQMLIADPSWISRVERGVKRLGPHPDFL